MNYMKGTGLIMYIFGFVFKKSMKFDGNEENC